jgi:hypothetical protein
MAETTPPRSKFKTVHEIVGQNVHPPPAAQAQFDGGCSFAVAPNVGITQKVMDR